MVRVYMYYTHTLHTTVEDNLNLLLHPPPPPPHYEVEVEKASVMMSLVVVVAHLLVVVVMPFWYHGEQTMDDDWSPAISHVKMKVTSTKL